VPLRLVTVMSVSTSSPAPVDDRPRASSRRVWRRAVAVVGGLVALLAFCVVGLRIGALPLSWHEFFHAFFHDTGTYTDQVVLDSRAPEVLLAVLVGAALAVAGAVMQGLTHNPLADAGILGITQGASLFVVVGMAYGGAASYLSFVWWALPGALLGVLLGYGLALAGRGRRTPLKLTLAGVITGSILGAATEILVFLNPQLALSYVFWATGDVDGRNMAVVYATGPVILVGVLIAVPLGRALNGLGLGEDVARALGQRVERTRAAALVATVLLAGAAVAAAGPIGFIGLAAPTCVRALIGNDYRWILPLSAVYGAVFLVVADILSRIVWAPIVIPSGLVMAVIGVPVFLFLVSRQKLVKV
jgi:iron complex transport system permease protein